MRLHHLPRLLLAPLAAVFVTACGVAFSSTFEGTEMFKGIEVTGDRVEGSELTVTVWITPVYPVPVEIGCYYEDDDDLSEDMQKVDFHDRAHLAGKVTVERAPDGVKPGDEVEEVPLSFTFTPPIAGDYFIACLTPAAPDNGIGVDFEVLPRN